MSKDKSKESAKDKEKDTKDRENDRTIKIAVQFLLNPKVENSPDDAKKSFLKKKG